eukprot:scaffold281605_cov31-Tisochrysis_lutea.AAC.1
MKLAQMPTVTRVSGARGVACAAQHRVRKPVAIPLHTARTSLAAYMSNAADDVCPSTSFRRARCAARRSWSRRLASPPGEKTSDSRRALLAGRVELPLLLPRCPGPIGDDEL